MNNHFTISSILTEGDGRGKKRARTIFSAEQLKRLETQFLKQQYIVGAERTVLAKDLNLSETQVKVWFQNRRIKWRRQNQQSQQSHLHSVAQVVEADLSAQKQVDWQS